MNRARRGAALLAGFAALWLAACAPRVATPPVEGANAGRGLYAAHCRGCHGAAGDGNGEAAAYLDTRPADLRRLWQLYGTPLDRARLAAAIDGRGPRLVHGPRAMPVWGEEYFGDAQPGIEDLEAVRARLIDSLIDYLETLQSGGDVPAPRA